MRRKVRSIYDLAQRTGVSASTVSRVLNDRPGISGQTRRKVLSLARSAGFRPRMTARPSTVAVVVDRYQFSTVGGFVPMLLSHLVEALSEREVAVELLTQNNLQRLQERLVDGVLAMAWDDSTIAALRRLSEVPVVTINRMDVADFSAVASDHWRQAATAVDYLAGRGHHRIAMLGEEPGNWGSQQRIAGFTAAMKERGIPVAGGAMVFTDHQPMLDVLVRLMDEVRPTAIYVAGEDLALETSSILRDSLHLAVPGEVSLLGMESARVSQFMMPPMTALCQPMDELVVRSVDLLLAQMHSAPGSYEPRHIMLQSALIERESVRVIRA